jgi:hypothetical protein
MATGNNKQPSKQAKKQRNKQLIHPSFMIVPKVWLLSFLVVLVVLARKQSAHQSIRE